jgi:ER membrane protein complex subunit 1
MNPAYHRHHPPQVLSYNRTVEGLTAIHSVPATLESTSLVLATGLDVWFTRAHPSKTFDLLSDDFNHRTVRA